MLLAADWAGVTADVFQACLSARLPVDFRPGWPDTLPVSGALRMILGTKVTSSGTQEAYVICLSWRLVAS